MAELLEANDIMFTPFEPKLKNRFIMNIDGICAWPSPENPHINVINGMVPVTSTNIAWDDTNKVFSISKAGIYEVVCDATISINVTRNVSLEMYINTAADTLGTQVHAISFEVDSGDDPVPVTLRWMGRIENGEHIAVTLQADASREAMFTLGSPLRILRIA